MSKKKSFSSEALSTITGAAPSAPVVDPTPPTTVATQVAKEVVAEAPAKVVKARAPKVKNKAVAKAMQQPIKAIQHRNTTRAGKACTLYLNTQYYTMFKEILKEEGKTASSVLNNFIVDFVSERV